MPATGQGTAFLPCLRPDLDLVFSLQFERIAGRDNTVQFQKLNLQIEPVDWRGTLFGSKVTVHQHLDGTLSLTFGPHRLGRFTASGLSLRDPPAEEKTRAGKVQKATFPPRLEIPPKPWDSHFPAASTTAR